MNLCGRECWELSFGYFVHEMSLVEHEKSLYRSGDMEILGGTVVR